jgi:hypothetical protein
VIVAASEDDALRQILFARLVNARVHECLALAWLLTEDELVAVQKIAAACKGGKTLIGVPAIDISHAIRISDLVRGRLGH